MNTNGAGGNGRSGPAVETTRSHRKNVIHRFASSLVLGLCLLGASAFAGRASASCQHYAAVVISNPSPQTLHYEIKWGDEDWKSFDVDPYSKRTHYLAIEAGEALPKPRVRFDCVTHDDDVTLFQYVLHSYRVTDVWDGKDYYFEYSADGRFLDLFAN